MTKSVFLLAAVLISTAIAHAQTQSSDSQTLKALLDEVRQLRQDLKANAALGQRSQLLISRLQVQQDAVDKAAQRLENARAELGKSVEQRKDFSQTIKYLENQPANGSSSGESNGKAAEIARLKSGLEKLFPEEQERQAAVTTCEDQLRAEQSKLAAIQDELDQMDKALKKP
jgi:chromosome segregation ATPase